MNFSEMSNKLTKGLTKELDLSEDKKEIIAYAIETTLLSMTGTAMIVCLAYSLDALIPALIASVFGGTLRRLSGGAHFDSPLKCLVFGAVVYSFIGVIAKTLFAHELINQIMLSLVILASLLLSFLLAPVDSDAKPIHSASLRVKLKIASISFVLFLLLLISVTNNYLISVSAVLGVLYQSITLLPIFNRKGGDGRL